MNYSPRGAELLDGPHSDGSIAPTQADIMEKDGEAGASRKRPRDEDDEDDEQVQQNQEPVRYAHCRRLTVVSVAGSDGNSAAIPVPCRLGYEASGHVVACSTSGTYTSLYE